MRTVKLIDMTLTQSSAIRGDVLSFKEKLEIARLLDRLNVDAIELPVLGESKADELSNKTIAATVSTTVCADIDIAEGNVEKTWDSIKSAKKPQLNVITPVSPVQIEYTCHKKAPALLEDIGETVGRARFYCENVTLTLVDATRAEIDYLAKVIGKAIEAGAGSVTLCDTAGILMPDEFADFVKKVKENVPSLEGKELYIQTSDNMNMAAAGAAFAIAAGADGVKTTALPAGTVTLENIAHFMKTKGHDLDIDCKLRNTELSRAVSQLGWMVRPQEKEENLFENVAIAGAATGVVLDESASNEDVENVVRQLGYDLTEEDSAKVYDAFVRVAKRKHFVGTKELDAIVASTALQVPSTYHIEEYVINSGNVITATANILLTKDGEQMRGVGVGDGPIDAAFLAIEQIIGHHYELDDFQIQTVTEGRDAMGSALVKLRSDGRVYSGSGISTDIIGASIRAYISALNKIVYEEN